MLDLDYIQIKHYQINLAVRGISRTFYHCPKQADPISPQILLEMHHEFDLDGKNVLLLGVFSYLHSNEI